MAHKRRALAREGRWTLGGAFVDDVIGDAKSDAFMDPEAIRMRSRQDCEDLIALLERVKERLPDGK